MEYEDGCLMELAFCLLYILMIVNFQYVVQWQIHHKVPWIPTPVPFGSLRCPEIFPGYYTITEYVWIILIVL